MPDRWQSRNLWTHLKKLIRVRLPRLKNGYAKYNRAMSATLRIKRNLRLAAAGGAIITTGFAVWAFTTVSRIVQAHRAPDSCNCAVAGLSFGEGAVIGVASMMAIGIVIGVVYFARTIRRTRRILAAMRMEDGGEGVAFFHGGPCEAFTFGLLHPRVAVCAHCAH